MFIDHNQNVGWQDDRLGLLGAAPARCAGIDPDDLGRDGQSIDPEAFTIATIWDRIGRYGDLFAPLLEGAQRLEAAETALGIG